MKLTLARQASLQFVGLYSPGDEDNSIEGGELATLIPFGIVRCGRGERRGQSQPRDMGWRYVEFYPRRNHRHSA